MAYSGPFYDGASFQEILGPAMEITEQDEADAYFEKLVAHAMAYCPHPA